jgi:hypothetical protein
MNMNIIIKKLAQFFIVLCLMLPFGVMPSRAQEEATAGEPLILFPAYLQTPLSQPVVLDAETYPEETKLTWISLDPSVATVNADGCVTPVTVGETYVICAFADNAGITASCGVRVTESGNMFFWEYTPEPEDLDAAIDVMEQSDAEVEIDLPKMPNIPWPNVWPDEIPRMEGKVAFAYGDLESEQGLIVSVTVEGSDVVERFVSLLNSTGFNKGTELAGDNYYSAMLDGKGYNVMVVYQDSEKICSLIVKK